MALIVCPLCVREDDVILLQTLPDGRKELRCEDCDFVFTHGERAAQVKTAPTDTAALFNQFPTAADVSPDLLGRSGRLKASYLTEVSPRPDPRVGPYWAKYRDLFSGDELAKASPTDLKAFGNDQTGLYAGFMTVFNNSWNSIGDEEGARRVRAVTEHLLRGPGDLEDRFTALVKGEHPRSMAGWKEALLTKTLAVSFPDRFLSIVTYDQKREVAGAVYGLDLPPADKVSWTIGRLSIWSNDLLRELVGDGFAHGQHAAAFLWWAKDQR
ncbi:hypothetical protein [Aeromicrobium stalagmiti]|uniref:hypothetical protein n=1 Tax=Aeromicrobium stalagmiti TaxID=2738988 RepID=UPI0015684EC6|nr:hypothetical protein [Aeromicrobium stalagmiti]NRQ50389.1 hypothetical protein [Aeromicrobium stalagmiti]